MAVSSQPWSSWLIRLATLIVVVLAVFAANQVELAGTADFLLDLVAVGGGAGLLTWVWIRTRSAS